MATPKKRSNSTSAANPARSKPTKQTTQRTDTQPSEQGTINASTINQRRIAQQQKRNFIVLAGVSAVALGVGLTASLTVVKSTVADAVEPARNQCHNAIDSFNVTADATRTLFSHDGTRLEQPIDKEGLTTETWLDPAIAPAPAPTTLTKVNLLLNYPGEKETITFNRESITVDAHSLSTLANTALPGIGEGSVSDEATTIPEEQIPTRHFARPDYEAAMNKPDVHNAWQGLIDSTVATLNGDNEQMFQTPPCESATDLRQVARAQAKITALRDTTQDQIDHINHALAFTETTYWCSHANDFTAELTELRRTTLARIEEVNDAVRRISEGEQVPLAASDQDIIHNAPSDMTDAKTRLDAINEDLPARPSCQYQPGDVGVTRVHDNISAHHTELDSIYSQLVAVSVQVNTRYNQTSAILNGVTKQREQNKRERTQPRRNQTAGTREQPSPTTHRP